jgi:hypothetical protein
LESCTKKNLATLIESKVGQKGVEEILFNSGTDVIISIFGGKKWRFSQKPML